MRRCTIQKKNKESTAREQDPRKKNHLGIHPCKPWKHLRGKLRIKWPQLRNLDKGTKKRCTKSNRERGIYISIYITSRKLCNLLQGWS
jgi:hypothetical protein